MQSEDGMELVSYSMQNPKHYRNGNPIPRVVNMVHKDVKDLQSSSLKNQNKKQKLNLNCTQIK